MGTIAPWGVVLRERVHLPDNLDPSLKEPFAPLLAANAFTGSLF